ncbi:hydroxyacid dehydrogenase [[Clostridium] symbiosum]|uniref:hydroxyacid dehydrogenase n=1 Tax=Clostridium symbiosum TaxID=1512 RepID=UPI0034A3EF8A
MGKKILLPQDIAKAGKNWLLERGYELKPGSGITSEIMAREVKGCSAVIARLGEFNEEVLESEPGLKVIARHGAGYDNIDIEAAKRLGISVTYDPVSNIGSVAEHVIALILGCSKKLIYMDRETRTGNYKRRNEVLTIETSGKILGIAGYGRIGRLVAEKARYGLGMKILVYDPIASVLPEGDASTERADSLEMLLERSDFVSIHMPLNSETTKIMGKKQFKAMKKTAYFINAARGGLADEKALIEALENGWIAGAALDVFEKEPPDFYNPLMQMEQVILSPHNAALTVDAMDKMALTAAKSVDDVLSGRRPEYCVVNGCR